MAKAIEHFEHLGYSIEDVSRTSPFDLLASKGREVRYVEVKGTAGEPSAIFLTRNEVAHAQESAGKSVLFVLHSIEVRRGPAGVEASGGVVVTYNPWTIDPTALEPLQYRYSLQR